MLVKSYESWNGWKAKVIVDMAGYGDAVFMRNSSGRQEEYEVEVYVSTSIVISKAVEKEEWG